jgi:hypothetical protein
MIKTGLTARFFSPIARGAEETNGLHKREAALARRARSLSGASYSGLLFLLIAVK